MVCKISKKKRTFIKDFNRESPTVKLKKRFLSQSLTYWKKLMLSALKVKCFQPDFAIIFTLYFANSENATKFKETSEFRQETLNILNVLNLRDNIWHFMNEKSVLA